MNKKDKLTEATILALQGKLNKSKKLNEEYNYRVQVLTTSDNVRYLDEFGKLTPNKNLAKSFTNKQDAENVAELISEKSYIDVAGTEEFIAKPKLSIQQIIDKIIKDNNIDNELAEDIEYHNWSQQDFISYIKGNYNKGICSIEDDMDDYNASSKKELYDMWKLVYQKLKNQNKVTESNVLNTNNYLYRFVGGEYDRGYGKEYTRAEAEKLPILQPQTTGENPGARDELKNQLKFRGYLGPMFDGYTDDGKAIIRYETSEMYDAISR